MRWTSNLCVKFWLLLQLVLFPGLLTAQSGPQELLVPLYVNGTFWQEVTVYPQGSEVLVSRSSLLQALVRLSPLGFYRSLSQDPRDRLAPDSLDWGEVKLAFDPRQLALTLELPARFYPAADLKLNPPAVASQGTRLGPAWFSGSLTWFASLGSEQVWNDGTASLDFPADLSLDAVANLDGWVGQTEAAFSSRGTAEWQSWRLFKDWDRGHLRTLAGHFVLRGNNQTSLQSLIGFELSSQTPAQAAADLDTDSFLPEFFLDKPAQVKVWVNDSLRTKLDLAPGVYRLRQLDLPEGLNRVRLEVPGNALPEFNFVYPFSLDLLPPGKTEFSWSAGVLPEAPGQWAGGGWQRLGLLTTLTLGTGALAALGQVLPFASASLATPVGNFNLSGTLDWTIGQHLSPVVELLYRFVQPGDRFAPRWSVHGQYRDSRFTVLRGLPSSQPLWWQGGVTGDWLFSQGSGLSASVSLGQNWFVSRLSPGFNLNYRQPLGEGLSLTASLAAVDLTADKPAWTATAVLTYRPKGAGMTVTGTSNLVQPGYNLAGDLNAPGGEDGLNLNWSLDLTPEPVHSLTALQGEASFRNWWYEAAWRTTYARQATGVLFKNLVNLSGSLVAAQDQGHWGFGLSRPVNQAYLLVAADPGLDTGQVGVNPRDGRWEAAMTGFSGAVLPDLQPGRSKAFTLDLPQAAVTAPLNQTSGEFLPQPLSGGLFWLSRLDQKHVQGRVTEATGKPLAWVYGKIYSDQAGAEFFTDETGRFQAYNLPPGRYKLKIRWGGTDHEFQAELLPGSQDQADWGDFALPAGKN